MSAEPLLRALARMRSHILDPDVLVRAVGSGRQKGAQPRWKRVELRWVDLKAGRHLQVRRTTRRRRTPATTRSAAGRRARRATRSTSCSTSRSATGTWRPPPSSTRCGSPRSSRRSCTPRTGPRRSRSTGSTTGTRDVCCPRTTRCWWRSASRPPRAGSSRAARPSTARWRSSSGCSTPSLTEALAKGHLRRPTDEDPLRVVDLGCGNAYLTFAAQRYLTAVRGLPVRVTGVDVKQQSADHNTAVAEPARCGGLLRGRHDRRARRCPSRPTWCSRCTPATPRPTRRSPGPWSGRRALVLAAPCCHHDVRRPAAPRAHARAVRRR